jgi:hypothetical protein
MNKLFWSLAIVVVMFSCGDDDSDPTPASSVYMKAKVGDKALNVTGTGSSSNTAGAAGVFQESNKTLYLNGNDGKTFIAISVVDFPKATGTFTIGKYNEGSSASFTDNTDSNNPVIYLSKSGTVTVSKFDGKTIEGTFSFIVYNTALAKEVTVSGGEFKMIYTAI